MLRNGGQRLSGKWGNSHNPIRFCKIDTVAGSGGKLYYASVIEQHKDRRNDTTCFFVHILQLRGGYFLDGWIDLPTCSDYMDWTVTKHFFLKMRIDNPDSLLIYSPDADEFRKGIDQKKIPLHYLRLQEDDYLILDKPGQLQKGLAEANKIPLLYKDTIRLVRMN